MTHYFVSYAREPFILGHPCIRVEAPSLWEALLAVRDLLAMKGEPLADLAGRTVENGPVLAVWSESREGIKGACSVCGEYSALGEKSQLCLGCFFDRGLA